MRCGIIRKCIRSILRSAILKRCTQQMRYLSAKPITPPWIFRIYHKYTPVAFSFDAFIIKVINFACVQTANNSKMALLFELILNKLQAYFTLFFIYSTCEKCEN